MPDLPKITQRSAISNQPVLAFLEGGELLFTYPHRVEALVVYCDYLSNIFIHATHPVWDKYLGMVHTSQGSTGTPIRRVLSSEVL